MKIRKALIVYQNRNSTAHKAVRDTLEEHSVRYSSISRARISSHAVKAHDLIISVGGDGTFLRLSHFVKDKTPVIGVNAEPSRKVGFFTCCDAGGFRRRFRDLLRFRFRMVRLTRLSCSVNGGELEISALNEFAVGHTTSFKMARYELNGEFQRSSGVLVGTASGSYAWIRSAGGRKIPLESRKFQYVVREPYLPNGKSLKHLKGILRPGQRLRLKPCMGNLILVVDCLSGPVRLRKGDLVEFAVSGNPLYTIR